MRFKKGTKVEVLTLKEGPSASWRCAEIIGISSRRYTVRYEGDIELSGKGMVEGVSQRSIRPRPPPVDVLQDWLPGDVVEVFQNFCWKMATILKVSGRNHVLVRLLGSPVEYKANKYDVRARLCWHNDEWNLIGKASNKCDDFRFRLPSPRNDNNEPRRLVTILNGRRKCGTEFTGNTNIVLESQAMRSKTVKRKRSHSRPSQKKIRLGNIESLWNQLNAAQQPQLPEKVENIASSRGVLHEKRMHPSLIDNINGYSEMIMEREKTDGVVGYSHSICLDSSDDVSVSSSVGSFSVYRNSSPKLHHLFSAVQYEGNDSESSDAESFCQLRFEERDPVLPAEDLIDEIHRLELHAYRCTIGALYASGPLSWEQELLLTNLRHSLHISNDEHLAEIRNLVSSRICIPTS